MLRKVSLGLVILSDPIFLSFIDSFLIIRFGFPKTILIYYINRKKLVGSIGEMKYTKVKSVAFFTIIIRMSIYISDN